MAQDQNDNRGGQGNTSNRGFASMDEDKQREIAAKGGREAHAQGRAHEFDSEEAREAGRKGGDTTSQDREFMSGIGRKGGENSDGGNREGNSGNGGNQGGSSDRGFGSMDEDKQRDIASRGGQNSGGGR